GDARRDDLAVLVDEVLEERDVLVVDFLDVLGGEAAELAAAKQPAVLLASILLGEAAAFSFTTATRGGSGHESSPLSCGGGLGPGLGRLLGRGAFGHVARLLLLHHRGGAGLR